MKRLIVLSLCLIMLSGCAGHTDDPYTDMTFDEFINYIESLPNQEEVLSNPESIIVPTLTTYEKMADSENFHDVLLSFMGEGCLLETRFVDSLGCKVGWYCINATAIDEELYNDHIYLIHVDAYGEISLWRKLIEIGCTTIGV